MEAEYRPTLDYAVLGLLQEGVWVSDRSDVLVFVNAAMGRIAGVDADLLKGRELRSFPEETLKHFLGFFDVAKTTLEPREYECPVVTPGGTATWQGGWLTPLVDGGNYAGMICTVRDITEHKQLRKKLERSEATYRTVVQDQTEAISRFRPDGTFIFVNDVYCRTCGKTADELIGDKWHPVVHPEDIPLIEAGLAEMSPDRPVVTIECRVHAADNRLRWMQFVKRGLFDSDGRLKEIQSVGRDITHLKQIQNQLAARSRELAQALAHSDELLRLATDGANVGLWYWSMPDGEVTWNDRCKQMLGLPPGELPSIEYWVSLLHLDDRARLEALLQEAIARRSDYSAEYRIVLPDGAVSWIHAQGRVFVGSDGEPTGMGGVLIDITARKQLEATAWRSSEIMKQAQQIAHLGSFEFDVATQSTQWSDEEFRIYGLDPAHGSPTYAEMIAHCIHPEDVPALQEALARMMQDHGVYELEHRIVRPDGSVRWVANRAEPMFDEQGRLLRYVGTTLDITERRTREQELRDSETKYRIVADNTYDWELWIDPEGRFLYCSPGCERITGHKAEEYLADPQLYGCLIHPGDRGQFDGHVQDVEHRHLDGECEWRIVRADGAIRWIAHACQPVYDKTGRYLGVRANNRDVTERQALEEGNRRLVDIITETPDFVGTATVDGVPLYLNPAGRRMMGWGPGTPLPLSILDVFSPASRARMATEILPAVQRHGSWRGEIQMRVRGGVDAPIDMTLMSHRDEKGVPNRISAVIRDITDRKRAEAAAIGARAAEQASRTKTQFLAAASHDLRQPLQTLNLYADALALSTLDERQRKILDNMMKSARNLGGILNQLLDISKLDAGMVKFEPATVLAESILVVLDNEFARLAADKHLRFDVFASKHCPCIHADAHLLTTVLRNLVGNAIKYTEHGGILVSIRRRDDRVLVQVRDTGIGMSEDDVAHIFEEYFQVNNPERDRAKGYGLGLSIVRRLARLMDTEISCRSVPGKGSVFALSLPLPAGAAACAIEAEPAAQAMPAVLRGKRIVIVEDDGDVAQALTQALVMCDIDSLIFPSAEAALASPETRRADYFLCDLRLPGIDGLQLLETLQESAAAPLKAVLFSGETSPRQVARAKAAGWTTLTKPIHLPQLLLALERL